MQLHVVLRPHVFSAWSDTGATWLRVAGRSCVIASAWLSLAILASADVYGIMLQARASSKCACVCARKVLSIAWLA